MLSPARRSVAFGAAVLLASNAHAQDLSPVSEATAATNSAVQIIATAEEGVGPRLDIWQTAAGSSTSWLAVLNEGGKITRVSDSDCSPFKSALDAYASLPDLSPGPVALQPRRAGPQQIPNRRADGAAWRIRVPAYAPDLSSVQMEITGSQGPYAGWVSDTIRAIKECEG